MEVVRAWVWLVRFDDRLRTVLGSPAADPRDRAVRWRQLVELIARGGSGIGKELFEEAIGEIRSGAPLVDEQVRMATARAIAPLPLPLELISTFAADRVLVAAPVLAAARLTAFEWGAVLASASVECRKFIQALRSEPTGESEEPEPSRERKPAASAPEPDIQHQPIPSISEVVARIERLRQAREPLPQSQALEPPAASRLFRWESDENGEIAWVEGVPRGPLIGRSIAHTNGDGAVDRRIERALAEKVAFRDAKIELAEGTPVAGTWMISGTPAFDPATGRFAGYRGVAERKRDRTSETAPAEGVPSDPDSLRDLAHEIKTPLNAIIGFAEIISGQYLGPAHHPYRARAAEIAVQARLLLTAVEDLDFAAKLRSRPPGEQLQVHLGAVVEHMISSLREIADSRGVKIETSRTIRDLTAAVDPELAERLIKRMCIAVIERAEAGECLRLAIDNGGADCRVSISRPKALRGLSEEELFGSASEPRIEIFPLRLTRGLARIANAQLIASEQALTLVFPSRRVGGAGVGVYS